MLKIIQDYKNWNLARKRTKREQETFDSHTNSIIITCDDYAFQENRENYKQFLKVYNSMQRRSSSCFYKSQHDKTIYSCVNVDIEKDEFFEKLCNGCPYYKQMHIYRILKRNLADAKEKQNQAKQKLLDNFYFWKQR